MDFGNSTMGVNKSVDGNLTSHGTEENPVTIVIFVCLGIIGCLGNGFVLFIFCNSQKLLKSSVNVYLINQSAIDLMASLMLLATAKGVTKSTGWSADSIQGKPTGNKIIILSFLFERYLRCLRMFSFSVSDQLLCRLWVIKMPLWSFLFSGSYNLIALNIERYISIIAPLYHKTKVRMMGSYHKIPSQEEFTELKLQETKAL